MREVSILVPKETCYGVLAPGNRSIPQATNSGASLGGSASALQGYMGGG